MNDAIHLKHHTFAYASMLAIFSISLATLATAIMAWVWVLFACSFLIALVRLGKQLPGIKNITLNLLAIFCMLLLVFLANDFGLMATMVNLLIVAACLKLINMQTVGDYHTILIIQFFLIASGLIYHQNLFMVTLYFLCILLLFCIAFWLNKGRMSILKSSRQSTKLLLQAIPITILLFIVVPRLPPFWQAPVDKSAQTGLSETLTPGDIANLAKSDELVFRAQFNTSVPTHSQRYWRSIVLDYFDGKTWSVSREITSYDATSVPALTGDYFEYLVMAEANNTRWLFSLDIPLLKDNMGAAPIYTNDKYQLYRDSVSSAPSFYIVNSYYQAPLTAFTAETDFAKYLQLPLDTNPKTTQWVTDNITKSMSFDEKLATLNHMFIDNGFRYTLQPPMMPNAPVDQFLFTSKQGFCSHYASALTFMLRSANIPARMVAGYQGGTEESDQILSVRQFDAHAWVEAYDSERGWVRYDPTALVAPNRALSGLLSALNSQETAFFNSEISGLLNSGAFANLRSTLAVIDFNWNTFVLGFNQDSQSSLITELFGELTYKAMINFIMYAIGAIILFVLVVFLPYKKLLHFEANKPLDTVLKRLRKFGLERKKHETLETFFDRIEHSLSPKAHEALKQFIRIYYQVCYHNSNTQTETLAKDRRLKSAAAVVAGLPKQAFSKKG